ncbi:dynein heavy chain domain-containing protein 1 [Polymixia lowei]
MNLQGTVPGVSTRLGGPKAKKKGPVPSVGVACRPSLTFPPLCQEPLPRSPALVCRPLSGRTPILEHLRSDPPLSVVGLPRLIAQVGPEMAIGDTMWMEGPRLMASALGTDIPVTAVDVLVEESTGQRPYDLREVHPGAAGSEHYIFSRNAVLHVTETGCGGLVTLAEWYRESVLWRALQDIPFFRDHRLRKSFAWWHRNVRKITFRRRCEKLQDTLLMAVPRFRQALFLFSSAIEELNEIHRLPQDELKTYTLLEFKNILIKKSQECLRMFEKFVQYRTVILNAVQEDSYREHQEMQLRVERSKKPKEHNHPLHLQLAHQQELQKDLARAEHVLQKLGNVAALVNQMVVQGLVAFTQRDVTSFLNNVMKREKIGQGCLFHTELIFSADGQLTVDPALHLFQEVVREALLTVVDSAIQMSDTCCLFLETGDIGTSGTFLSGSAQGLTPVLSLAGYSQLPAITGDYQYDDNGMTGLRGLFCRRETTDQSAHVLVLPKLNPFTVQGQGVRGCYYPLSKRQLEWQLRINDVSKEVEREQARIMQETQSQIQQLCDGYAWLVDVHLFISQWSVASPDAMKGQPAFVYEEHIEKVRHWTEKIHTVSPSFTTSNQLFIIHCAHILEKLGLQLKSIEEDVLTQLVDQTKLHSESLISNLKRAIAELEKEPIDFYEFAEYATMVKRCEKTSADMQQHLEYVRSLQDTICTNYRNMSEQEVTLKEQQAEKTVYQRLPSMSVGLDQIFSYLVRDLDRTVSGATSGLFLDPAQNADEMFSMLNVLCRQAYASSEKLKELSLTSTNLRGHPLDLTVVTTSVQKIETRKELWELMSVCTAKIQEWSHLPFSKVYREAKAEWDMEQAFWKLRQAWEDRVFLMGKLTVPVRQRDEPQRRSPCAQRPSTDAVLKNQTAGRRSCDGTTLIVAGLEGLLAETEDSVMTLSNMLISPHIAEFKLEVEHWLEKFAPVDKTFKEIIHSISSDPRALNIVCSKKTNDQFRGNRLRTVLVNGLSVMEAISKQMLCLLDAPRAQFPRLCFLSDKEVIKLLSLHPTPSALLPVVRKCFKGVRWLEVDRQIPGDGTDLNSCLDTSDPHIQMKVLGIFGRFREHVAFLCPVEPNPDPLVWLCTLEKQLHRTMTRLMKQCAIARKELELVDQDLERGETCNQDVQPVLDLLSDYPLQCLLVAEEAAWCSELLKVSQVSVPEKWSRMKKHTSCKLKNLCHAVRELITSAGDRSVVSDRAMMFLRALVQFTMNHTQQLSRLTDVKCELRSSFEWQSLMKFRITSDLQNPNDFDCRLESGNRSTCYVDVLGSRLLYGYEYLGPEHWTMVNTPSTDRAVLGLLLALTGYRCGFVSGPCMSGKTKTAVQLGRALGRQVIAFQCCLRMSPSLIQQMLLGALQTGAWLVLDSADLMTQGVLSLLGQHLVDIRQAFSAEQRVDWEPKDRISDAEKGYENLVEPDCPMSFAGKSIFAKLSYGCIIISSKGYTTEIPESLRAATRPVALTQPDYRIIAEVTLASSGFSDAVFLSQRLVSLFSLAKDSLFLPDFINKDHISWVVVLQNVIAASVIHLKQSIGQRQVSHKGKASAEERKALMSSHDLTDKVSERDGEHEDTKLFGFKHINQCAAVIQGVMEEKAVVKALFSVFLPAIHEAKKASQFQTFLEETFPMARSFPFALHYIEEKEQNLLRDAVAEEVQRTGLHSDAQVIRNALTLYQALKFSPAVLLIGPSGSGKTTCYRTLAGALRSLAARAVEDIPGEDNATDGDAPPTEPRIPVLNWSSVDTVVLFPNAMSREELFGGCAGKGRWDGAVAKALRESECRDLSADAVSNGKRKRDQIRKVKWLVMDGEPLGRPGWLDCFGTLCSPEDPALRLSSGEKIAPSHSGLKLLAEITDLGDANPSTVTRCAVTYFTGTDLWKAVWKVEMDALSRGRSLDQESLNMWNRLTEDLFGYTLKLLRQNALTSAVHTSQFCESPAYGLQEITSFIRILHALLEAFGTGPWSKATPREIDKNDTHLHGAQIRGTEAQIDSILQEQQAKDIFLVAYIWGFGGHLHPRHWPQFDLLARQALFNSRYRVEVPRYGTVFEHFFSQSEGTVGDIINSLNCPSSIQAQLADPIVPKYEKYAYLLDLMLEAKQPVLLVGEAASGKTSLCKTLLSQGRPHISLPASQLLSSPHVRNALHKGFRKACPSTAGATTKQSGLLLFVDDLHEAPRDASGKVSKALETLRQSILKGGTLTSDGCHFKLFNSGAISYMATCRTSGSGDHSHDAISPRLSRLFSIFVLPGMSVEVLFSVHSPRLKLWLKDFPCMPGSGDMASGIIAATEDLYRAVRERFQPAVQRSHVIFTQHDLQKVFQGMYLWQPCNLNRQPLQKNASPVTVPARSGQIGYSLAALGPAAAVLNIARLWMHECLRVFSDRLCSEDKSKTLASLIAKVSEAYFGRGLVDDSQPVGSVETPTATIPVTSTLPKETETRPKPFHQSDWKRVRKLTELSLQMQSDDSEEPRPGTPLLPLQLLQHTEESMDQIVYGPDLSEPVHSNFKRSSSYQEREFDLLVQRLPATVKRKAEDEGEERDDNYSVMSGYAIHRRRVHQLLHVVRALLVPGGHGVLFSSVRGTGRKTTVRLAACLMDCQLMEVHPGNEGKLRDILKEAGHQAGTDSANVVILAHEEISLAVREELLAVMAHGACPALYSDEELASFLPKMDAVKNLGRCSMHNHTLERYLKYFQRNVHVFLLMPFTASHSSNVPGWNEHVTKALSLSCCVEVYQPWSRQSLEEAAAHHLKASPHIPDSDGKMAITSLVASLSLVMARIHQSACRYASVHLITQPFSPQTYMNFIAHYFYLCSHLREQGLGQANRVATVLAHLEVLTNTALQYKQDTVRLQEKVAETQQCEKELLRAVDIERRLFKEARQSCVVEETNLFHLEEQIQQTQQQINRYFEEVSPLFLTGLETVKCLSASDLEEVRHYRNPPEGVVKIMDSLCLLFDRPRSWESAKQLLGQSDFFQELEFFDRYKLTNNKLQQLAQIVDSPHFLPESVREVSQACESLCCWVRAVYRCARTKHRMSALDASKRRLGDLAAVARGRLRVARLQEEEVGQRLEDTERQLQFVGKDLDELLLRLSEAENLERQAAAAVALLESHIADWTAAAQEAKLNNRNIPGDAVVLAATISYLGPFGPDVRTELLSKWKELCLTGNINVDPEDPRTSLFADADPTPPDLPVGFSVPMAEKLESALARAVGLDQWRVRGLQPRLVVKLLLWAYRGPWAQRWPLLANAQHHEEISSGSTLVTGENTRFEMEAEYGMVVCADHPELLDKLGQAAEKGLRVLVTHVERAVPSPEFLAMLVRPAGSCLPGLRRPLQPAHPEFCLFLSTRLPVRLLESEIHPSILADVGVVDLSLSSAEIQEVMLTQLLPSLCMEPLIQHSLVQNDKQAMQYKLVKEQVSLMDYIQQSFTPLLQDSDFLPRVISCREASQKLQAEIQHLSAKLERYDSLLAGPRGAARLAAAFYQALQEVARLSPAYFFSLRGFIATMRGALNLKDMPGVSDTGSQVTEGVVSEITHRMVAHLLAQYRPCLFQGHATLLRLLVSVALLQHRKLCSEAERTAFLRGLGDVDLPPLKAKPFSDTSAAPAAAAAYRPSLPGWIPSDVHPELLRLERTRGFRGLVASLATYPRLWQEYLRLASSTVVGAVPCHSHSHLSLLQRALLWKTVLPDRLAVVAEDVAACQLGLPRQASVGEDPHTGNPEALSLFLVKHEGPVILTLPDPARERWASVDPLHLLNQLTSYQADTKEVQLKVISFGVRCEREVTLSGLDEAAHEGHWLVFNNCHLLEQWDDKVMFRINQLTSPPKDVKVSEGLITGGPSPSFLVHPRFRLWFITRGCNPHSIPAAVRMCALHLVCDSPRDVKEELSCSLRQVASGAPSGVAAGGAEPLLRCAVLHSVLLQRQAYKHLGQGNVYRWTQEDLLTLVEAYGRVAGLCRDRTEALEYIAVNVVYGGHVSDSTDLEVVKSVAKACLSAGSPLWGGGPHALANIVSVPGYFDTSGLLQGLEHRIQGLANISDPLVLGFSADLAAEVVKMNSHTLNIMLRDSQTPLRKVRSSGNEPNKPATLPGYVQARDRLRALKSNLAFKDDGAAQSEGPVPRSPLRDFLQAEWDGLRDLVSSLLSQLRQPVQRGTPDVSSLLQVANLSRLERRAELLRAYLWDDTAGDPSTAFRLSAFKNARGFLVAVMREAAQAHRKDVSDVALEFQVLSVVTSRASLPPGSVYLCGLELRGALWDTRLGALQDTLSPRPCLLPLLNVRAGVRRTDTCRTLHVKNTDTVQSSDGPQANATRLPVYQCPLYLDGERESGDTNIVTRVPLLAKLNPVLCSLRRVRLVSTL